MKTALKRLQELDFRDKISRYANVPRGAIPSTVFNDRTANALTRAILRWLELHGHYATRITTTGRKLKDVTMVNVIGQAKVIPGQWIPGTTRKGTADIHAVIVGTHCSIEVKVGKDRMSEAQERTREDVHRSGGRFFIAKSFESFHEWYTNIHQ